MVIGDSVDNSTVMLPLATRSGRACDAYRCEEIGWGGESDTPMEEGLPPGKRVGLGLVDRDVFPATRPGRKVGVG